MTNGTPPTGHGWGERTRQAHGDVDDAPPHWKSDAYEIRHRYGIPRFDESEFEYPVYPDCVIHEMDPERTSSEGGTDCLIIGERGCGKTTHSLHKACRLMDENGEKVVWRGSSMRSGWLPLKHWTTLWLPEHAGVTAHWMTDSHGTQGTADLEGAVREVRTYADPGDLLEQLGATPRGTFHVVYPDPSFSGCRRVFRDTDRASEMPTFRPKWMADGDETATPVVHWWYALAIARVDQGPFEWHALIFDEVGDLTPADAKEDEHSTYSKLSAFRSAMADSRRARFSLFMVGHHEENLHHKIRREFKWRVSMPDGTPNPRKSRASSIPVGFKTVPMETDIVGDREIGTALMYTQSNFTLYRWPDIPGEPEDQQRWLKISLSQPVDVDDSPAQEVAS